MQSNRRTFKRRAATALVSCLLLVGTSLSQSGCSSSDSGQAANQGGQPARVESENNPPTLIDNTALDDVDNKATDPAVTPEDSRVMVASNSDVLTSEANLDTATSALTVGSTQGDLKWTNGFALVSAPSASLSGLGVELTTDISLSVKTVSPEELISFIQTHRQLFTDSQYSELTTHKYYLQPGYGADLLLSMLGLVLSQGFDYYRTNPTQPMTAQTQIQKDFLAELGTLHERSYTMKGKRTAVTTDWMPASPRFYAEVTRVKSADGSNLRAVNTRLLVTDQNNGSSLAGKANEAPLGLFAATPSADAFALTRGYGVVAQASTEIGKGEQVTLDIAKAVKCVSHQRVIAFVNENQALFTAAEYEAITGAPSFNDVTRTPEFLLGIIGIKLGSSFSYFAGASTLEIAAYDEGDKKFVAALSALKDEKYTLSGRHTVVGVGSFSAVPRVFALVTRVVLPDGTSFRTVSTQVVAADEYGKRDDVRSQENSAPLELTPG